VTLFVTAFAALRAYIIIPFPFSHVILVGGWSWPPNSRAYRKGRNFLLKIKSHRVPIPTSHVHQRFLLVITFSRGYRGGYREPLIFFSGVNAVRPHRNSNRLPLHYGWFPPVSSQNGLSNVKQPTTLLCVCASTQIQTLHFSTSDLSPLNVRRPSCR